MLRPSPNHGTQRLPNDDDDDDTRIHRKYSHFQQPVLNQSLKWEATCIGEFFARNLHQVQLPL